MEKGMDLRGSKREKNLEAAFTGESKARHANSYYADAAQKAGNAFVSDVFLEIARNEDEHARRMFEFLDRIKDTRTNLESAAQCEESEKEMDY